MKAISNSQLQVQELDHKVNKCNKDTNDAAKLVNCLQILSKDMYHVCCSWIAIGSRFTLQKADIWFQSYRKDNVMIFRPWSVISVILCEVHYYEWIVSYPCRMYISFFLPLFLSINLHHFIFIYNSGISAYFLINFDNFCIIGNRNAYSTIQVQTISLQLNYVSTLPGKSKKKTAQATVRLLQCIILNWLVLTFV